MIDESTAAARLFGDTMPAESEPAPPAASTAPRFVPDGSGALRDTRTGARAPAPARDAGDPAAQEAQRAARQYGPSHDAAGNALDPLESIGAQTPEHILQARAERDPEGAGKMFTDGDNAETRLAIDKAIDQIDPGTPAVLKQSVVAEYVACAADIGLEPTQTAEIARAAQSAFADGAPDADTRQAWRFSSGNIAKSYGTRQSAVVAEAQRMVRNDPRVAHMLARSGLGDHPTVVRHVLAAADRRLRAQR